MVRLETRKESHQTNMSMSAERASRKSGQVAISIEQIELLTFWGLFTGNWWKVKSRFFNEELEQPIAAQYRQWLDILTGFWLGASRAASLLSSAIVASQRGGDR